MKAIIGVRKEVILCSKCKTLKTMYYLSDFSYGERLFNIQGENEDLYAYVNLLQDKVFEEFRTLATEFLDSTFSQAQIIKYVNSIFGITCDLIDGKEIDTSTNEVKCTKCGSNDFEHYLVEPEQITDIVVEHITHENWNKLSEQEKKLLIQTEIEKRKNFKTD